MQSLPEADLRTAASQFFAEPYSFSILGGSSGFSDSTFARVEKSGVSWCLRQWPASFEERRLRFIHRALLHCRANGFPGVPALAETDGGDTVLYLDGHLFDAQEWLVGEPLSGRLTWEEPTPNVVRPLPSAQLATLAAALARFHRSTSGLRFQHADEKMPLSQHLMELGVDMGARKESLSASVRARAVGSDRRVALRWLELLPRAIALSETILRDHPGGAYGAPVLCHGDLWASHVHFAETDFVGFVDFESLCFSSPTLDLAQLILHFNGWEARDAVVSTYRGVFPLDGENEAVLPVAAIIDLAGEGCWSLNLLYGEDDHRLRPAQREAHVTNLRVLLESLELVVAEIEERTSARR